MRIKKMSQIFELKRGKNLVNFGRLKTLREHSFMSENLAYK